MEPTLIIPDPTAVSGALLASALLGGIKRYTTIADTWAGRKLKPLQPLLITAGAVGLPYLSAALGIGPIDADALVTAPAATVLAITLREIARRVKGSR